MIISHWMGGPNGPGCFGSQQYIEVNRALNHDLSEKKRYVNTALKSATDSAVKQVTITPMNLTSTQKSSAELIQSLTTKAVTTILPA